VSYLVSQRIKAAKDMLGNSDLRVSQIAYQVGYNDIAHFNRSFKKLVGVSPKEYRVLIAQ